MNRLTPKQEAFCREFLHRNPIAYSQSKANINLLIFQHDSQNDRCLIAEPCGTNTEPGHTILTQWPCRQKKGRDHSRKKKLAAFLVLTVCEKLWLFTRIVSTVPCINQRLLVLSGLALDQGTDPYSQGSTSST